MITENSEPYFHYYGTKSKGIFGNWCMYVKSDSSPGGFALFELSGANIECLLCLTQ